MRSNTLDFMEDVSDRIKKLRKELRLTQKGLGAAAHVTKQAVSQWERGLTSPERDALLRLMDSHRVNPEWVSSGNGVMFTPGTAPETAFALPPQVTRFTRPPDPLITQALALLEATDHDGRVMALTAIKFALKDHHPAQANPEKSSG